MPNLERAERGDRRRPHRRQGPARARDRHPGGHRGGDGPALRPGGRPLRVPRRRCRGLGRRGRGYRRRDRQAAGSLDAGLRAPRRPRHPPASVAPGSGDPLAARTGSPPPAGAHRAPRPGRGGGALRRRRAAGRPGRADRPQGGDHAPRPRGLRGPHPQRDPGPVEPPAGDLRRVGRRGRLRTGQSQPRLRLSRGEGGDPQRPRDLLSQSNQSRHRYPRFKAAKPISSFDALGRGDFVVHVDHGIGSLPRRCGG